ENSGAIITPSFGISILTDLELWTANDYAGRDPASYRLLGTNSAIGSAGPGDTFALSLFTEIAQGALALPASRNAGGPSSLLDVNSQTISFTNSAGYSSYLLLFPTVKISSAGSMQLAEAQLFGTAAVPEPATLALMGLGLAGIGYRRHRSKQAA
ncbi:MAG: PEP-CTERM sorting domain-containing protein, partial [Gammaproteobacteria bacterium]|nr:PEP-CTERM sorting domain-containing protein [Gammaproteobacteria bacterium]